MKPRADCVIFPMLLFRHVVYVSVVLPSMEVKEEEEQQLLPWQQGVQPQPQQQQQGWLKAADGSRPTLLF